MLILKKNNYFQQNINDEIVIRTLTEEDVTQDYVDGINDNAVNLYLVGARIKNQTFDDVRSFVRLNENDKHGHLFGLFIDNILRGTCRLHEITELSAYLGIAIFDRSIWGKSYGTSLIQAVSHFGIRCLNLKRIEALIHEENVASIKAFEKANFITDDSKNELKSGVQYRYFVYNGLQQ